MKQQLWQKVVEYACIEGKGEGGALLWLTLEIQSPAKSSGKMQDPPWTSRRMSGIRARGTQDCPGNKGVHCKRDTCPCIPAIFLPLLN